MTLKEKLRVAKEKKEFKMLEDLILSENDVAGQGVIKEDVSYQYIIDIAFERQVLLKNEFDINVMKKRFESFISEIDDREGVVFCVTTKENVFFVRLEAGVIKINIDFFWSDERLYKKSQDRIFFHKEKNIGFTVLKGEYGLEVAEW